MSDLRRLQRAPRRWSERGVIERGIICHGAQQKVGAGSAERIPSVFGVRVRIRKSYLV